MIDNPGLLLTLFAFLLVIGPLVFIHEMGHYLAGRLFGVKAEAFSIGFGREVAGWTDRRGTRWKLGWMPLGGYVRFAGDMNPASQPSAEWLSLPAEERARTFQAKPVWQRAIIVAAGPVINFLAAILILAGFAFAYGDNRTPAVAGEVVAGGAAARAGFQPGDRILSIAGRDTRSFNDIVRVVRFRPQETLAFEVERNGQRLRILAAPDVQLERDRFGNEFRMGLMGIGQTDPVTVPVGLLEAPLVAVRQTGEILTLMTDTLGQIITGRRSVRELGGPIAMANASGEQMMIGWETFAFFVALISINLGFINLLPVPMLDGGHLLFYAIEAVRRKPVSPTVMEWAFRSGLLLVLSLMVFVTINDLINMRVLDGLVGLIG
ncbi:regulator of sigma E protease [Sphingomonas jejuensis]|uniref:Zinc metalloprotease n=1 Tax=Sphingomonas jejuensis TaxID=904715 RepID=A0ABX0XJU0_9SPHN|nr:RIP metalloprotease RseP [Sphingomonas jejuensis]NJC33510.1 regulator of sigma E protease [Sphingomonas jejuensis]